MTVLADYQSALVGGIADAMRKGARRVVAVAPTGAGKTVMFAHTTKKYDDRGKRVLILAHRESLVEQAANKLRDEGLIYSTILSGRPALRSNIRVGMVQTVAKRLDREEATGYDLIHVDEGHHAVTRAYTDVLDANPQARVIIWTASPLRLDGRGLGREYGGPADALVDGPTVSYLQDRGFLVRANVVGPDPGNAPDLSSAKIGKGGDYIPESLEAILNTKEITGDAERHYRRFCPGVPAIAFCCEVKHALSAAEEFRQRGWRALAVFRGMDGDPKKAIAALGAGELDVLMSCDLIGEGLDLPNIGAIIKLRSTASLGMNIQWDGRPLRPLPHTRGNLAAIAASTKPIAWILDHCGNVWKHGWPDTDRTWSLEGSRKGAGEAREPAQCPNCLVQHPPGPPKCPNCGHDYRAAARDAPPPLREVIDVDIGILDPAKFDYLRDTALKKLLPKAKTLEDLKAIEIAKQYKDGWAEHMKAAKDAAYLRHRYGNRV